MLPLLLLFLFKVNSDCPLSIHEASFFEFTIYQHYTTRQGGTYINIHVKYQYITHVVQQVSEQRDCVYHVPLDDIYFMDYRIVKDKIKEWIDMVDEVYIDAYWEYVVRFIGRKLMKEFPLWGVIVNIMPDAQWDSSLNRGATFKTGTMYNK